MYTYFIVKGNIGSRFPTFSLRSPEMCARFVYQRVHGGTKFKVLAVVFPSFKIHPCFLPAAEHAAIRYLKKSCNYWIIGGNQTTQMRRITAIIALINPTATRSHGKPLLNFDWRSYDKRAYPSCLIRLGGAGLYPLVYTRSSRTPGRGCETF